jgi:hypothetical protein
VLFSYMLLCLQYAADVTNNSMHAVYKLLCILQVMDRVVVTPDGEQPPPQFPKRQLWAVEVVLHHNSTS